MCKQTNNQKQLWNIIHNQKLGAICTPPSNSCGGLRGPLALLGIFGPLFHNRRCQTKHAQFCVKIGPIGQIRSKRSKQVKIGQNMLNRSKFVNRSRYVKIGSIGKKGSKSSKQVKIGQKQVKIIHIGQMSQNRSKQIKQVKWVKIGQMGQNRSHSLKFRISDLELFKQLIYSLFKNQWWLTWFNIRSNQNILG